MIYITGDIHGSPERLGVHSFYEQKEMTRDDIVIICGECSCAEIMKILTDYISTQ